MPSLHWSRLSSTRLYLTTASTGKVFFSAIPLSLMYSHFDNHWSLGVCPPFRSCQPTISLYIRLKNKLDSHRAG